MTATFDVTTLPLGGSELSRAVQGGRLPAEWQLDAPASARAWKERIASTQAAFAGRDWWQAIAPAVSATGRGRERLERVAAAGGVVVTTGQQPGLFGGPVYTWSKALTALALADEIERATGVRTAPLFWAATDDGDLAEAQRVWVSLDGGASELRGAADAPAGTPVSAVAQGDLLDELALLRQASGSAMHADALAAAEAAYGDADATIGSAYLTFLEHFLAPLGIAILDASHASVRAAGDDTVRRTLRRAREVDEALRERSAAIRAAGFEPQVADVPDLTPVFVYEGAVKRRVALGEASDLAARAELAALGPNVLLRPVMEAAIVPTVAYAAGPGELAYFAQVTAVATALDARVPVAVPRWSARIVESRIERMLARLGVAIDDLEDPHAAEAVLARGAMPEALSTALAAAARVAGDQVDAIAAADGTGLIPAPVLEGMRTRLVHQFARLERRAIAAVKRREAALMRDVATARGYLFPGGKPQERALSLVPFLARSGPHVLEAMLAAARAHARALVFPRSGSAAGES